MPQSQRMQIKRGGQTNGQGLYRATPGNHRNPLQHLITFVPSLLIKRSYHDSRKETLALPIR